VCPSDLALVVAVGATTPQDPYVDKLAKLAVDHAVAATFTGPQSRTEVAATLREARVLLVPSFSETYGLVALEAAASGTPVIASDTGGLREAVVDGKTGVLMGTRDPQE